MFDPRDTCLLDDALARFDELVNAPCLHELTHFPVSPSETPPACLGFIQIEGFPVTDTFKAFSFVLNALESLQIAIGYVIQVRNEQLSIYIGIKGDEFFCVALEILRNGLIQTFPGIQLHELTPEESCELIDQLFSPCKHNSLATISVIPNTSTTTPILTSFNNLMGRNEDFVLFLLATPVSLCHIRSILNELICLFNILSGFSQGNHTASKGLNKNGSTTVTRSNTETNGRSCTDTNTSGSSHNSSQYKNITSSTSLSLANNKSLGVSLLCNDSCGHATNTSRASAEGITNSEAIACSNSRLTATNLTENEAIVFSIQNKCVVDALATLNLLITRYTNLLTLPAFEFGAYLIAPCLSTTVRGAYTYLGVADDPSSTIGPTVVNVWDHCNSSFCTILKELQCFNQPFFESCSSKDCLSSTTIISGLEFISTLYFV